jgi:DNA-binding NtrC family response regulator
MKKDLNELKSMVLEIAKNPNKAEEILKSKSDLFVNNSNVELNKDRNLLPEGNNANAEMIENDNFEEAKIQDISHEVEEESLSIHDKEKELIIKALKKYKGKRKLAAEDLKISERTLYRKLKEYDLEHL